MSRSAWNNMQYLLDNDLLTQADVNEVMREHYRVLDDRDIYAGDNASDDEDDDGDRE